MKRELDSRSLVRLGLPKGRMEKGITDLMREAGIELGQTDRAYRPSLSLSGFEVKLLKPQNILKMLLAGTRDIGFAGADWVAELEVDVVEVLDTGLDPVRLVAAAPMDSPLVKRGIRPGERLVVASEYERLTKQWMERHQVEGVFVRSYGATEVFPPEDADCILDITASGSTLHANNLIPIEEVLTSSTRLYANKRALDVPALRQQIEDFALLLRGVLEARKRVFLEMNVTSDRLETLVNVLPALRKPTIAMLHGEGGYAVKVAVPRKILPELIPQVKAAGGTDLIIIQPTQIIR